MQLITLVLAARRLVAPALTPPFLHLAPLQIGPQRRRPTLVAFVAFGFWRGFAGLGRARHGVGLRQQISCRKATLVLAPTGGLMAVSAAFASPLAWAALLMLP